METANTADSSVDITRCSVVVDASPEEVYDYLIDVYSIRSSDNYISEYRVLSDDMPQVITPHYTDAATVS